MSRPNCHRKFIAFNKNISIDKTRARLVQASRRNVERDLARFCMEENWGRPIFKVQGSYRLGTVVMGWAPDYDLDLGLYLNTKPPIHPKTLKKRLNDRAFLITYYGSKDKMKCIQILYRTEYSIDIPVYYLDKKTGSTYLATKKGWKVSDPIGFHSWVSKRFKGRAQPIRIIRYLKMWSNDLAFKSPSGVALTVWIAKNYIPDRRDDVSFIKTLKRLSKSLKTKRQCIMTAAPYDNLIRKLSRGQISNFIEQLDILIQEGSLALRTKTKSESTGIWKANLGDYFPD